MKICSIDNCISKHKGHGYCDKHYQRFKKYGDPLISFPKKSCAVNGCEGKYYGSSYCNKHYLRWKFHRDLNHVRCARYESMQEAYEAQVIKSDDCWGWNGSIDDFGYGLLTLRRVKMRAHRFSYEYQIGPIPEGIFVCHKCDHPACTNPSHLFLGTNQENIHDCVKKDRHARGERSGHSKITQEQAVLIKTLLAQGSRMINIVHEHNFTYSTVSGIKSGRSWKHIEI